MNVSFVGYTNIDLGPGITKHVEKTKINSNIDGGHDACVILSTGSYKPYCFLMCYAFGIHEPRFLFSLVPAHAYTKFGDHLTLPNIREAMGLVQICLPAPLPWP